MAEWSETLHIAHCNSDTMQELFWVKQSLRHVFYYWAASMVERSEALHITIPIQYKIYAGFNVLQDMHFMVGLPHQPSGLKHRIEPARCANGPMSYGNDLKIHIASTLVYTTIITGLPS